MNDILLVMVILLVLIIVILSFINYKLFKKVKTKSKTIAQLRLKIGSLIQKEYDSTAALFPYIPEEWRNSFFHVKRDWIINNKDAKITASLDRVNMSASILGDADAVVSHTIVAHCNMVIPSKRGTSFVLADPYGSITTEPFDTCAGDDILSLAGRIVIVYLEIHDYKFYVKRIKRTIYAKEGFAN